MFFNRLAGVDGFFEPYNGGDVCICGCYHEMMDMCAYVEFTPKRCICVCMWVVMLCFALCYVLSCAIVLCCDFQCLIFNVYRIVIVNCIVLYTDCQCFVFQC